MEFYRHLSWNGLKERLNFNALLFTHFEVVNISSWTPEEQPIKNNYQRNSQLAKFYILSKNECFAHVWKGTKTMFFQYLAGGKYR